MWENDKELFHLMRTNLFPAAVGDILDTLGYLHQFIAPVVKPIRSNMVVVGRAMPVLEADVFELHSSSNKSDIGEKTLWYYVLKHWIPYRKMKFISRRECSLRYALWGGLMSARAIKLKAAGAVLDGFSRDTSEIYDLDFPVFSHGTYAQDQGPRGKVIDYRVPIEFSGVRVNPRVTSSSAIATAF